MASSASLMARLQLQQAHSLAKDRSQRVGEILSDHSDGFSSSDEADNDNNNTNTNRIPQSSTSQAMAQVKAPKDAMSSPGSDDLKANSSMGPAKVHQKPSNGSFSSSTKSFHKKNSSKKWYSESEESEEDEGDVAAQRTAPNDKHQEEEQQQQDELEEEQEEEAKNKRKDKPTKPLPKPKIAKEPADVGEDSDSELSDLERKVASAALNKRKGSNNSPTDTNKPPPAISQIRNLSDLFGKRKQQQDASNAAAATAATTTNKTRMTLPPPQVTSPDPTAGGAVNQPEKKKTGFQKLVAKTKTLSPFSSKRNKGFFESTPPPPPPPASSVPVTSAAMHAPPRLKNQGSVPTNISATTAAAAAAATALPTRPRATSSTLPDTGHSILDASPDPTVPPTSEPSRRTSRPKHSPTQTLEVSATNMPGTANMSTMVTSPPSDQVFSPSQRKVAGAFAGRSGSGVLLEGWLRQKQRRGVKGMKKWNSRYFVLYARTNEVRYYTDVVQSAWGPIPLGELGSISLRLIQRIGKPSHPKYKGCRFDITCRNTWGTHYADDYVSSEEENDDNKPSGGGGGSIGVGGKENVGNANANTTPKSSRVYSLMADSPQTAVTWVNMLDSLLVRSANSPRPDISPASNTGANANSLLKRIPSTKIITRRRSSTLEVETTVITAPNQHVPKAVVYAINFIFDSTPGIETWKFYESEPESSKLRNALKFLNQFAMDPWLSSNKKATKEELDQVLDVVTAGGIIKLWLKSLETPLVPFEMFDDFATLANEVKTVPFEYQRHLKALVALLPPKNFAMLACLLFHLNDVFVYASKNGMDAPFLAHFFGEFILRSKKPTPNMHSNANESRQQSLPQLVEEMILHVDTLIDEKEAEIINKV